MVIQETTQRERERALAEAESLVEKELEGAIRVEVSNNNLQLPIKRLRILIYY